MKIKILISLLLFAIFYSNAETITWKGYTRKYFIHVPEGCKQKKNVPLLIVLHGGGGKARKMAGFSKFNLYSDRDTFIVLYPQGYHKHWNDGRISNESDAIRLNMDDTGFIKMLIEKISGEQNIDPARIYACGASNGGMMCYKLVCELPRTFAATASVIANMPYDLSTHCKNPACTSMLIINGTADPLMPYEGGQVHFFKKQLGRVLSGKETLEFWRSSNGCTIHSFLPVPMKGNANDPTSASCELWNNPSTGTDVKMFTISGGGHTWPGGIQFAPRFVIGRVSSRINASEEILNFMKEHTLK